MSLAEIDNQSPDHTGDSGAIDGRCVQLVPVLQKDVAHRAGDDTPILPTHNTFIEGIVLPLCSRKHLIEPVQMLHTGKLRIFTESVRAHARPPDHLSRRGIGP